MPKEPTSAVEGQEAEYHQLTERERRLLALWYPALSLNRDELVARYGVSRPALWACNASALRGEVDVQFNDDVVGSSPTPHDRGDVINKALGLLNCKPIDWNEASVDAENEFQHSEANDA